MLENVNVLCHSSIKIINEKVIYFDPFRINKNYNDADIIMITHNHYDHYSEEDINKVRKNNTVVVIPEDLLDSVLKLNFAKENILTVQPNKTYTLNGIKIETIPAYNINKKFHPKENNWVGYLLEINNTRYYIAGDTDITEENSKIQCDIALVPIGGTYTMNYKEAAKLINHIKPRTVIPTHYGEIVGTKKDSLEFSKLIDKNIKCEILI